MAKSFFEGFLKGFGETGSKIVEEKRKVQQEEDLLAKKYDLDFQNQNKLLKAKVDAEAKKQQESLRQLNDMFGETQITTGATGIGSDVQVTKDEIARQLAINPSKGLDFAIAKAQEVKAGRSAAMMNAETNVRRADIDSLKAQQTAMNVALSYIKAGKEPPAALLEQAGLGTQQPTVTSGLSDSSLPTVQPTPQSSSGIQDLPVKPYVKEEDIAAVEAEGLPKDIIAKAAFRGTPAAKDLVSKIQTINEKERTFAIKTLNTVEADKARVETLFNLVQNADTGFFTGPVNLIADKLSLGGGTTAALNSVLKSSSSLVREEGEGAQSNDEMKAYITSLADITNPKNVNLTTVTAFFGAQDKLVQKLTFLASTYEKVPVADRGKVDELFNMYYEKNPPFVKDKEGNIIFNPVRYTIEEWDFKTNTPKESVLNSNKKRETVGAPLVPIDEDSSETKEIYKMLDL